MKCVTKGRVISREGMKGVVGQRDVREMQENGGKHQKSHDEGDVLKQVNSLKKTSHLF